MRKSFEITSDHDSYVFSLVRWGFFRKFAAKLFRASPFDFVPSFELAIYKKVDGKLSFNNPYFVFHFADEETAQSRTSWVKQQFQDGLDGIERILMEAPKFDRRREGMYSGPGDYFDRMRSK